MSLTSWLRQFRSALAPGRQFRRRPATSRPQLEILEDRRVLSFSPAVSYAVSASPQALVTGYFNNDTILDIAVAHHTTSTVSILLGNADGTFQNPMTFAAGVGAHSLAVGDLDGDSDMDLATANAGDVSVLLGNGDGSFQPPVQRNVSSAPASVAVGDFNGDGTMDLAATTNFFTPGSFGYYGYYPGYTTGYADVLLGTGGGAFAAPTTSYLGYGYHLAAVVADFNDDGKDDFATLNYDGAAVGVLLGTPTGFGALASFATNWYPQALTVGDFTSDGILDLAAVGQTVDVLPGLGNGTFHGAVRQNVDPVAVVTADFNDDGHLDLVTADYGNTVNVLLGTGAGTFRPPINVTTSRGPAGLAVGDFNGDGRPDLVSSNVVANDVAVLLNDGVWPALDAPSISVETTQVAEGNSGPVALEFTVRLSAASAQTVTVRYATDSGSATLEEDYQETVGELVFAPGVVSQTVPVLVNGDRVEEPNEFFLLRLSDPTNAFVATASALGLIFDDEPLVSIDYGPVEVTEGNAGTRVAEFTVRLAYAYDEPVSVNYSTVEGDTEWWTYNWYYGPPPAASAGSDFDAVESGTVTFEVGETVKTIPIAIHGDRRGEQSEYFSVNLTGSTSATIGAAHAVGVIVDDEPLVRIDNPIATEGNTGTTNMTFTLTLSAPSDEVVTVTYTTADDSATVAGGDYQFKTDTVTFGIGETSKSFTVLVNGDRRAEFNEAFTVILTGATGAYIDSYSTSSATILDDEPRFSIESASIQEGNKGTKLLTFRVTLSAPYDEVVTVNYTTQDGSAKVANNDYVAKSGVVTFASGQTTQSISVTIRGDTKKEANEYFYVLLSGASSNALGTSTTGWGNILNDDGGGSRGNANSRLAQSWAISASLDEVFNGRPKARGR